MKHPNFTPNQLAALRAILTDIQDQTEYPLSAILRKEVFWTRIFQILETYEYLSEDLFVNYDFNATCSMCHGPLEAERHGVCEKCESTSLTKQLFNKLQIAKGLLSTIMQQPCLVKTVQLEEQKDPLTLCSCPSCSAKRIYNHLEIPHGE